jgi:hypothetical protein
VVVPEKKRKRELDLGPGLSGSRSGSPTVRVSWVMVLVLDPVKGTGVGQMSRIFADGTAGEICPVMVLKRFQ